MRDSRIIETLPTMKTAHALYVSIGFRPAGAYYANPLSDICYLALDLQPGLR